jgi:hypothetical protein
MNAAIEATLVQKKRIHSESDILTLGEWYYCLGTHTGHVPVAHGTNVSNQASNQQTDRKPTTQLIENQRSD